MTANNRNNNNMVHDVIVLSLYVCIGLLVLQLSIFGNASFVRQHGVVRTTPRSIRTAASSDATNTASLLEQDDDDDDDDDYHKNEPSIAPLVMIEPSSTMSQIALRSSSSSPLSSRCQEESQCIPFRQLNLTQYRDLQYVFTMSDKVTSSSSPSSAHDDKDSAVRHYTVCEFQTLDAYSFHFPHTMQQLYRCFSWWRLHHDDDDSKKQAVLIFPRSAIDHNAFLQGFVESLQATIGLVLVKPNQITPLAAAAAASTTTSTTTVVVKARIPPNLVDPINLFGMQDPTRPYYAFHQADDAKVLRDLTVRHLLLTSSANNFANDDDTGNSSRLYHEKIEVQQQQQQHMLSCPRRGLPPRIAILNRHQKRELMNADAIVERLQNDDDDVEIAGGKIPIAYFDHNTTFADQVAFFASVDVLISPHGAQLTGIPFLPDCAAVLEIFPAGYYLPYFFGSLASASSLQHGYVSLTTTGDWKTESVQGMQDQQARQSVRNKPLCPNVGTIVDAVKKLIVQWQQCCDEPPPVS